MGVLEFNTQAGTCELPIGCIGTQYPGCHMRAVYWFVSELNTKAVTCEQCVIVVFPDHTQIYFLCKGGIEKCVPVVHCLS